MLWPAFSLYYYHTRTGARTSHASLSCHHLLPHLFSVDCSVPFCRKEEAAATMDEPSQSEDRKLSAMEHVKKRHEEKGFLYAWSVSLPQATRS